MKIGLDVGSTTIKCVVLDDDKQIIYKTYERHYSKIIEKIGEILRNIKATITLPEKVSLAISGSAGMGVAEACSIPFVQEVYATRIAAREMGMQSDVIIELGGEDAKILFLTNGMEVRMNGSCAGGTGAFIDQMATLLKVEPAQMNEIAKDYEKIYTVASRCGVFAKSDIQPLLNQGARKSDIAKSIFMAVVNQTVAGLAQGRKIEGNVLYLGGPLTFLSELRHSFDEVLGNKGICPENSLYYVSLGAAFCADKLLNLEEVIKSVEHYSAKGNFAYNPPLFPDKASYQEFVDRHNAFTVESEDVEGYVGKAYLGIDAGSTTVKTVLLSENNKLLLSSYQSNSGNPVPLVKEFIEKVYRLYPNIEIAGSASTGYGEEIIKNAFSIDFGIVETMAHLSAAKHFMPDVEFVIDIGGQDIKCFKIRSGVIDDIFLNEACSSGCGSFLQTFANALGYSIEDFSKLALFANQPVDLGSRCTVFMNSSVKQAQKDGATIEDISAGLAISVVKNALYKVIRASSPDELGKKIVVQGGTFLNDAVLRAFEVEMGVNVVRPTIAGLMGAFGAALYAKSKMDTNSKSNIINKDEINNFKHTISVVNCGKCNNHCRLTVNTFDGNRKYIAGNRCDKPLNKKVQNDDLNIYAYKLSLLEKYKSYDGTRNEVIGIPMGLNMYELLPFWYAFFKSLGFSIKVSDQSNRKLYLRGQQTIPSDTVCFPAKLVHGHMQNLIDSGITTIFYPCMSYNLDEQLGDNHYNCPVVAYYPEVIKANMPDVKNITFIKDYLGIHNRKQFPQKAFSMLIKHFNGITLNDVKKATDNAFNEYNSYFDSIKNKGNEIIKLATEQNKQIIVLSGRPYHIDPEINHGIDKLILSNNAAIISEDVVSCKLKKFRTNVLNQWTYHSRLYAAAMYIKDKPNMHLVQLVSFGCGVDAITTDEVRDILEDSNKIYTQIKIDEITNLGAVNIRLKSLFAVIEDTNK